MATLHATPGPAGPEPEVVELQPPKAPTSRLQGHEGFLWILAAGVMLFIGILKGINLVIVLGYVLAGLWVINLWLARRALRGLTARRLPRPPLVAGVAAEWPLEVRDDGSGGGNWVLEERVGAAVASWLIVRAGGAAEFRPRVRATFPRRGKYTLEPLTARSAFPFGLASKRAGLLAGEEIVVLPRPARVDGERLREWLFRAVVGGDEERRKRRRVVEREAEIHGLRDYRPGDSPRRIHWKATARRSRLTVREYEDAAPPRLVLVVEPWLPAAPTATDRDRLEALISLAAGVVVEWRQEPGARLALVMTGPSPVALDSPAGPAGTDRLLIALALEEGGEPPADPAEVLGRLARAALAAPVLVVSSRADSPIPAAIGRALDRVVAFTPVGRPERWCELPEAVAATAAGR